MKTIQIIKCSICEHEEILNENKFKYFKPKRFKKIETLVFGCLFCDKNDTEDIPFWKGRMIYIYKKEIEKYKFEFTHKPDWSPYKEGTDDREKYKEQIYYDIHMKPPGFLSRKILKFRTY